MDLSHICKIIGHSHLGFRFQVSGVSSEKVRAGLKPCMKLHEIRYHFKKYLTAETAEYAEIILNFLSQRSLRAPR